MRILDELDTELASLESVAHGSIGDALTRIRANLQSVKFEFTEESRRKVLALVYAEAILGDISQDEFFEQLTKIINE